MSEKAQAVRTVFLKNAPAVAGFASIVGKKEGDGPLGKRFDAVEPDARAGQDSWAPSTSRASAPASRPAVCSPGIC